MFSKSRQAKTNKIVTKNKTKLLIWVFVVPIRKFPPKIAIPRIRVILAIFEPIRLVIAISGCFSAMAAKETASSGKEVPKATIVIPMIKGEIPIFLANFEEELIRISAEPTKKSKDKKIWAVSSNIYLNNTTGQLQKTWAKIEETILPV